MSVAIDTNIIVYALVGVAKTAEAASSVLESAASQGGVLVIAAPVYAELLAVPGSSQSDLDAFIAETRIRVDWDISQACWTAAGEAFAMYAGRRGRQKAGAPRRLLADFIIGTHAVAVGSLLTADSSFFRTNFPNLRVRTL